MVEFALVLPVLVLIVFGIIYFGRYESYSEQMTQLSEVGVRDAAVGYVPSTSSSTCSSSSSTANSIACFIQNQATGELALGSSDVDQVSVFVDCTGSNNTCTPGSNVTVCLQARVRFPALGIAAGTIYQTSTMRVESQPTSTTFVSDSSASSTSAGSSLPSC